MEQEVIKRLAQCRKRKWTGVGICALAIVYLIYLEIIKMDYYTMHWAFGRVGSFLVTVSVFVVYAVIALISIFIVRSGEVKILQILTEECDPFLYEACINTRRPLLYKNGYLCNRAIAQYYQGNFNLAWETFQQINPQKLKGMHWVNYYILLSDLYFKKGMGNQVTELEEAMRRVIKNKKDQKNFQVLCTGNNLIRAVENKDYETAFRFLQERIELGGNVTQKWIRVNCAWWEAKVYIGLGEKKSARLKLEYAVANGGRLYCAQNAKQLLEEL